MRRKANVVLAMLMKNRYLVAGAVVLVLALLLSTEARAEVRTGQYLGNGTTAQINTGLTGLKGLTIVHVAPRGLSEAAYTTNAIQTSLGTGTFLNGNKKDTGVALEAGTFTVTNPDFNVDGETYHWEARGD